MKNIISLESECNMENGFSCLFNELNQSKKQIDEILENRKEIETISKKLCKLANVYGSLDNPSKSFKRCLCCHPEIKWSIKNGLWFSILFINKMEMDNLNRFVNETIPEIENIFGIKHKIIYVEKEDILFFQNEKTKFGPTVIYRPCRSEIRNIIEDRIKTITTD